jgi:cell division protein ZapE
VSISAPDSSSSLAQVGALVDRAPAASRDRLVAELVPPPLFTDVRFETYRPDPGQPSQSAALAALRQFADQLNRPPPRRRLIRRTPAPPAAGVYLDGGFGVGKTHLLASLWHAVPPPAAYVTFVELTHLVGALGFAATVEALSQFRLVAIDEFELDDPGDTVLVSTLLARLSERGVALAATSNTVPEVLGEGRFAAEDFRREIQGLAERFETVRIDGPDYRHRGLREAIVARATSEVIRRTDERPDATCDDFDELLAHLTSLHPSRYSALVDGVSLVGLIDVHPVADEAAALRLVVLVDRLYDHQIPVVASGEPLDQVYPGPMLEGGYRKKYLRSLSRLAALARL